MPRLGSKKLFVVVLLIGAMLSPLNTTMISVGLVPIARDLGLSASEALYLVAGFYLFGAVCQPLMGTLADLFGPKRIYLASLLVVAAASVAPSVWPEYEVVLTTRILIGVGTSAAYPAAIVLIRRRGQLTGEPVSPRLLSSLSIASMSTAAFGPVVGGMLIQQFGWVAIFAINIPLALIALVGAFAAFPSDRPPVRETRPGGMRMLEHIDVVGMVAFGLVINLALLYFLIPQWRAWYVIVASAVSLVAFVAWCLRRPAPYIDLRMLRTNQPLARVYGRMLLSFVGPYSMAYAVVPWAQENLSVSAAVAGYIQIPYALTAGLMSYVAGRSFNVSIPLLLTPIVSVIGGAILLTINTGTELWVVMVIGCIFGLPHGMAAVSNQAVMFQVAEAAHLGRAASLSRTVVAVTAISVSGLIGTVFGEVPTNEGIHTIGWVVIAAGALNYLVTYKDAPLRRRH